ncbi:MAG: phage adaptor protein [Rhizomicrobium sp.]
MARGSTLVKLLDDLRAELKTSLNPAHNNQVRDKQVKFLQSTQEWLWEDFTWPHLRVHRNYKLQAGQYLYDVNANFDIDRIEKIEVKVSGRWLPVDPGIDARHYALHDTELDQRASPVRRWRIAENEQVEVWPIPDVDGVPATLEGHIKVTGIRKLRPLVADTDRCDLDDQLIYLYAAAKSSPATQEGKFALNLANKRLAKLKGNLTPRRQFKMFGIGRTEPPRRPFVGQFRPPGS